MVKPRIKIVFFIIPVLFILLACSACSPELRTLMVISKEQKFQSEYIALQERKFEALLNDIEAERIKAGLTKENCINRYGEPISKKYVDNQEVLLLRRPRDFFPSEKVYLYFDEAGLLKEWSLHRVSAGPL
jgi:hypothetical protein